MAGKSQKVLVKFETTAILKRALQLRALWDEKEMQEVVNDALQVYLAAEIEEVIVRNKSAGSLQVNPKQRKARE